MVKEMIGFKLNDLMEKNTENAGLKWKQRRYNEEPKEDFKKLERINLLKGISNDWCKILKIQCRLCPECINTPNSGIMNEYHMKTFHYIDVIPYQIAWDDIKYYHDYQMRLLKKKKNITARLNRSVFVKHWDDTLRKVKEDTEQKLHSFLVRST